MVGDQKSATPGIRTRVEPPRRGVSLTHTRALQQAALLAIALVNLASAALGNPYPSCIYIGHSSYKAMGARSGYLFLAMGPVFGFGMLHGAALLQVWG